MVKMLELAMTKAAQEQLGRELLERIDALAALRAEIEIGIRELDAGEGRELNLEEILRRARSDHGRGASAHRLGSARRAGYHRYLVLSRGRGHAGDCRRGRRENLFHRGAASERPSIGKPRNDVVAGLRSIVVSPHVVFYRAGESTLDVVRILHERQSLERAFGKRTHE